VRVISVIVLLSTLFVFPSCTTSEAAISAAQAYLEHYSIESDGNCDGLVAFNSKYLVVDTQGNFTVRLRKGAEILWEKVFTEGTGKHAYRISFSSDGEFIKVTPVNWTEVQGSMTWLADDNSIIANIIR